MQGKKQQLELNMEQWTGLKLGKEYIKAVLPVLLFNLYAEYNMWNARLDDSQAGIKIAWEEYQKPQICKWYNFNGRKQRGTKKPLDEGKRVKKLA